MNVFSNKVLSLSIAIGILLVGCKKKEEAEAITLNVTPSATFLTAASGEIKPFSISASSTSKLNKLKIYYNKENGVPITLVDSILTLKNLTFTYFFTIPNFGAQTVYLTLFIELSDEEGNSKKVAKGIDVLFNNRPLVETVENELYSRLSGGLNGYNIKNASAVSFIPPGTSAINITDSLQADTLSLSWISPSGGSFSRQNTFDYTNSTINSLKAAFEAGAKTNKLSVLAIGDLILFKQIYDEELFYAVIQLTDIQNNPGTSSDRYVFNIKK